MDIKKLKRYARFFNLKVEFIEDGVNVFDEGYGDWNFMTFEEFEEAVQSPWSPAEMSPREQDIFDTMF